MYIPRPRPGRGPQHREPSYGGVVRLAFCLPLTACVLQLAVTWSWPLFFGYRPRLKGKDVQFKGSRDDILPAFRVTVIRKREDRLMLQPAQKAQPCCTRGVK